MKVATFSYLNGRSQSLDYLEGGRGASLTELGRSLNGAALGFHSAPQSIRWRMSVKKRRNDFQHCFWLLQNTEFLTHRN